MTRALVTLATGTHQELLDIAMPSFERFADTHGYEIIQPDLVSDRPPSWWKVPALKAVLEAGYEEALWVDADIVIVDGRRDLTAPKDAWQALVKHRTGDGEVPNCAVWLVRQPMIPILEEVWAAAHRTNHGWWEQAAVMDLLGYQHHFRPAYLATPTLLYQRTHWLDNGFNFHMWDTPGPERVRFAHATMHKDRAAVMREWARNGVPDILASQCRHRYPLDGCYCATEAAA